MHGVRTNKRNLLLERIISPSLSKLHVHTLPPHAIAETIYIRINTRLNPSLSKWKRWNSIELD